MIDQYKLNKLFHLKKFKQNFLEIKSWFCIFHKCTIEIQKSVQGVDIFIKKEFPIVSRNLNIVYTATWGLIWMLKLMEFGSLTT